jgi:hypothetical protein
VTLRCWGEFNKFSARDGRRIRHRGSWTRRADGKNVGPGMILLAICGAIEEAVHCCG